MKKLRDSNKTKLWTFRKARQLRKNMAAAKARYALLPDKSGYFVWTGEAWKDYWEGR